jgi:hypothetical protein
MVQSRGENSMSNFTPGPWFVGNPGGNFTLYIEARIRPGWIQEVAACSPTEEHSQRAANARLIAAAPELLEALRETVIALEHLQNVMHMRVNPPTLENAIAAIAKAIGEEA